MQPTWILLLSVLEYSILALLFGLSVWSVSIMIERRRFFAQSASEEPIRAIQEALSRRDLAALRAAVQSREGTAPGTIREALAAGSPESVDRAVRAYLLDERARMESGMTVLATLGSNAPFIGLLGTVLGIIQAFGVLAGNQTSMGAVMTNLSKALVATAVGLFVAIPAVIAYNVFSKKIRNVLTQAESLRDRYLAAFPNGNPERG